MNVLNSGIAKIVVFFIGWSLFLVCVMQNQMSRQLGRLNELEQDVAKMRSGNLRQNDTLPSANFLALASAPPAQSSELVKHEVPSTPRRLAGAFMTSATTNAKGVGCFSFSATTTAEVDSASCADSLKCPTCFISTGGAISLNIVDCQDFQYKQGTSMSATDFVEILFINAGTGILTINSYITSTAGTLKSAYTLAVKTTVRGVCYGGADGLMVFDDDTGSGTVTQN
jgi:hypothetical protein